VVIGAVVISGSVVDRILRRGTCRPIESATLE
jgi:hypothetical protein